MSNLLWHRDVRLPPKFVAPQGKVELTYSDHAILACGNDKNGAIRQFKTLNLARFDVVEVGTCDGEVDKIVVRGAYNDRYDVVLALIPGDVFTVKTVWLNSKFDSHSTLDKGKYVK